MKFKINPSRIRSAEFDKFFLPEVRISKTEIKKVDLIALTPTALSTAWFTTPLERKQAIDSIKTLDQQAITGLSKLLLLLYQRVEQDDCDLYRDLSSNGERRLAKSAFRGLKDGGMKTAHGLWPTQCQQWLFILHRFILFDRFIWVHRCQTDHILSLPRHEPHESFPWECKLRPTKAANKYMVWLEHWDSIIGQFAIANNTSKGNSTSIMPARVSRRHALEPNAFVEVAKKLFASIESTTASEHTRVVRLNFLYVVLGIIAWFLVCIFFYKAITYSDINILSLINLVMRK